MRPLKSSEQAVSCIPNEVEVRGRRLPYEILFGLLLHLDIEEHKGMHTKVRVFLDSVVEAVRLPGLGEEDERDSLSEIIELQTASTDGVHDGCVMDHACWYL